jgi:predicted KAP-like P-loop ATPase
MVKKAQGFTDEAAQKDLFEIKKYIDGLATFIENCNTPMTISIQGAWGTGKTSIMQIVNSILSEHGRTLSVWFNTWQFSQFSMDSELAISLLSCLLDELSVSEEQKAKVTKTTQAIRFAQAMGRMGKEVALSVIDSTLGGRIAENVEKGINGVQETIIESFLYNLNCKGS